MFGSKTAISIVVIGCLLAIVSMGLWLAGRSAGVADNPTYGSAPADDVPVVSTRGHLADGELAAGHDQYDYELLTVVPGLTPATSMPFDLLVVVHGHDTDPVQAEHEFSVATEALRRNGFSGRMVGFSWDAGTQPDPSGINLDRRHATLNGPKLARFLLDYRAKCRVTRLHVVGCSLGAQVVLESLLALEENRALNAGAFRIDSVHLIGAAVGNAEVEIDGRYGRAIERRAKALVNYYSPADDALEVFYPLTELDRALGQTDIEYVENKPANYESQDVSGELAAYDDNGEPAPEDAGDNHSAYLGRLDPDGNLLDDGVMDLITAWIRKRDEDV